MNIREEQYRIIIVILACIIFITALWTLNEDARIVEQTDNRYRDMVCAEDGWPDYKQIEPGCGERLYLLRFKVNHPAYDPEEVHSREVMLNSRGHSPAEIVSELSAISQRSSSPFKLEYLSAELVK